MARWNNLPGALIAATISFGAFALYGHPWFGVLIASIFLITWVADTYYKRQESLQPCSLCGRTDDDEPPPGRIVTHPLRPLFFQVMPADRRDLGPACSECGKPTPKMAKRQ
jgi:hypothetical protein